MNTESEGNVYHKAIYGIMLKAKEYHGLSIDIDKVYSSTIAKIPNDSVSLASVLGYASTEIINYVTTDVAYDKIASALLLEKLYIITDSEYMTRLNMIHDKQYVSDVVYDFIIKHYDVIYSSMKKMSHNDMKHNYFSLNTLINTPYLTNEATKKGDETVITIMERIQDMYMRVAATLFGHNIDDCIRAYEYMSDGYFTHATPTLFNCGKKDQQLASCFLLGGADDLPTIIKLIGDITAISKRGGGIGIHLHDIRAAGSPIKSTGGLSSSVVELIVVYDALAKYVSQPNRRGSIAIYMEPWHANIREFIKMRFTTGDGSRNVKETFTALWMNDLFMERVAMNGKWSLMCPNKCPGLSSVYGKEFEELYTTYESEGRFIEQIDAVTLWLLIIQSCCETGTPYIVFKDICNENSNQKNIGIIKSSNLCTEIIQHSSTTEYGTCNLASISLPMFVEYNDDKPFINYQKLMEVSMFVTRAVNNVMDKSIAPVIESKISNDKHRPIGIGVQGLNDLFMKMKVAFDSPEAAAINKLIFETIYFGCLTESNNLAKEFGYYESFPGSPFSKGILQYHMYGLTEVDLSGMWDWTSLIASIIKYGTRNSLLTAVMPTASTSQILGNTESIEPCTSNIFTRTTKAGRFTVINEYMVRDLMALDIWDTKMKNRILYHKGSIQNIDIIPDSIKAMYKTAYEIKQKVLINMSRDRQAFIDQSQSLNIFIDDGVSVYDDSLQLKNKQASTASKFSSSSFYGWRAGLKTGSYYVRTKSASDPKPVGIPIEEIIEFEKEMAISHEERTMIPLFTSKMKSLHNDITQLQLGSECIMCSS